VIYFPPIVDNSHHRLPNMSGAKRKRLFDALVRESGLVCHWCREPVVRQESGEGRQANNCATLDHIKSRIFGGLDTRSNCVVACRKCNHDRGLEVGFLSGLAKFHLCAPNRLFGTSIKHGEAI